MSATVPMTFAEGRSCRAPSKRALEISKPMLLYPTDLGVFSGEPKLGRIRLRIRAIAGHLVGHPKSFGVVRMYPLDDLLNRRRVGNTENFLSARVPGEHAGTRIVLPPPKLSGVEGKLQTIFTLAEQIVGRLSLGSGPSKLRH
jgi:hypothetical protein